MGGQPLLSGRSKGMPVVVQVFELGRGLRTAVGTSEIESVFGGGLLYINDNSFAHSETFVGLEIPFKIGDTKFKLGSYYAVAYSNYSTLSNMFKFGINVFNPFSNSWAF